MLMLRGFILSLSIHILLFVIGGTIFVKAANYGLKSIPETIQVDLVSVPTQSAPRIKEDIFAVKPVAARPRLLQSTAKTETKAGYIQNPPPEYPFLAKQMHQQGLVLLSVDVDRQGMPSLVQIFKTSGYPMLDEAALRAVRRWKFRPGRMGDLPIESNVIIPIKFLLEK